MRNKFKIVAIVLTVVVGMVLYKDHFERKGKMQKTKPKADVKNRWN